MLFPLPFSHSPPRISNLKPLLLSTYFLLPDLALINEHKHEAPKVKILEAGTGFFWGELKISHIHGIRGDLIIVVKGSEGRF